MNTDEPMISIVPFLSYTFTFLCVYLFNPERRERKREERARTRERETETEKREMERKDEGGGGGGGGVEREREREVRDTNRARDRATARKGGRESFENERFKIRVPIPYLRCRVATVASAPRRRVCGSNSLSFRRNPATLKDRARG